MPVSIGLCFIIYENEHLCGQETPLLVFSQCLQTANKINVISPKLGPKLKNVLFGTVQPTIL